MAYTYVDEMFAKSLGLQGAEVLGSGRYFLRSRCPVCRDSQKSKLKKRFYFERIDGELIAHCWNCQYRAPFRWFIKQHFPDLYQDYLKQSFTANGITFKKEKPKPAPIKLFEHVVSDLDLQSCDQLPMNHLAVNYLVSRKVDPKFWNDLYYTDNFMEWAHKKRPDKFEMPIKEDKRILFVMRNFDKSIIGVSARSVTGQKPKYLTLKFNEDELKIFGLDRIDLTKKIYIVEGALDSLFLDNALAVIGAASGLQKLFDILPKEQLVIVADNEPRSPQTTGFIEKALKLGLETVVWPSTWKYKDVNEAIMDGKSQEVVNDTVLRAVFRGTPGLIRLKMWKKV